MPLIQTKPTKWIWERAPEQVNWEILTSDGSDGRTVYELQVTCDLEIIKLQYFSGEEIKHLASLLTKHGP